MSVYIFRYVYVGMQTYMYIIITYCSNTNIIVLAQESGTLWCP
jgi:hypothetical protein